MPNHFGIWLHLALLGVLGACAPAARIGRAPETIDELPRIPERDSPLEIELVYPRDGAPKSAAWHLTGPRGCRPRARSPYL